MSTSNIIALTIVIVAIIVLIVVGIVAFNKMKPTLNNFNKLSEDINNTVNRYSKDGERLQKKVEVIQNRIELTQMSADQKLTNIDYLQGQLNSLSDSLLFLKEHSAELSKENSQSVVDDVKENGPMYWNIFQDTAKRTFNKQKARYNQ